MSKSPLDYKNWLDYYHPHKSLKEKQLLKIRQNHLGDIFGIKIWSVDAEYVRDNIDIDFTTGGNAGVYLYIPENEIWIESLMEPRDFAPTIVHEMIEFLLMKYKEKSYDDAHDAANTWEQKLRKQTKKDKTLDYLEAFEIAKEYLTELLVKKD